MKKVWIKFLKDYNDGTTDFKKDLVVQVDELVAKSLVSLKMAEETTTPEDAVIKGITENLTKTLETYVENSLKAVIENTTKTFKSKAPAVARDADLEKMNGFKTKEEFLSKVIAAGKGEVDPRLIKTVSGQSTVDDVTGGFLVPEDIASEIMEFVVADNEILSKTDQRYTSNQSLKINTVPNTSRKDSYRHGGALAYWREEAGAYTSSTLKWGQMRLELHNLSALFYATDEELADANVALGGTFSKRAGEAIKWKMNKAFYDGTGAGMPLGILRAPSLISVPVYGSQSTSVPSITHRNISQMYYKMHPALRTNAVWLVHPDLEAELEFVFFNDDSTNARPIYMPPTGLSSSPYGTLKGRPVVPFEYCMDFGQKGDIVFVNWSQYITLQRKGEGIRSASSIHVRFLNGEQAFRFDFRVDGQPGWPSALEDLNGTTKRSWAVCMDSRSGGGSSSGS